MNDSNFYLFSLMGNLICEEDKHLNDIQCAKYIHVTANASAVSSNSGFWNSNSSVCTDNNYFKQIVAQTNIIILILSQ